MLSDPDNVNETERRLDRMESLLHELLSRSTVTSSPTPVERPLKPRTPTSRSSPATVRIPESRRPVSSVVRSLSFRQPLSVALADPVVPIPATSSSEEENEDKQSSPPPTLPSRSLKAPAPKAFGGSSKERIHADTWLQSAVGWMTLTAPGESDETLIILFETVLGDSPKKWLQNFLKQEAAKRRRVTLQDVFDEFMVVYFGGVSEKLAEQQLNSLVYGKDECKDLVALDSEFDRLAMQLYPGSETSKAATALLARIYSEAIRRGDSELWEKAMDAQPSTLDEWKVAAQNAYVILETIKAHHDRARREVRGMHYSKYSPSTSSSTSAFRSNSAVQVQKVGAEETSEGTSQEPGNEEEVQKAEVTGSNAPRPAFRPKFERLGGHLTFKKRSRLSDLGKCWICMEKGHRSFECEKKGKPGYPKQPTEEDLKS
jgi:hypothetical protein